MHSLTGLYVITSSSLHRTRYLDNKSGPPRLPTSCPYPQRHSVPLSFVHGARYFLSDLHPLYRAAPLSLQTLPPSPKGAHAYPTLSRCRLRLLSGFRSPRPSSPGPARRRDTRDTSSHAESGWERLRRPDNIKIHLDDSSDCSIPLPHHFDFEV